MLDPNIGGGVAPGRRGTKVRQTGVRRVPYWVPWDNDNKGGWRLIAKDTTHGAQLVDENNQAHDLYEAKGFIPLRYAPDEALPLLVARAQAAIANDAALGLPAPSWASAVLADDKLVAASKKVPAGASAA